MSQEFGIDTLVALPAFGPCFTGFYPSVDIGRIASQAVDRKFDASSCDCRCCGDVTQILWSQRHFDKC